MTMLCQQKRFNAPVTSSTYSFDEGPAHYNADLFNLSDVDSQYDTDNLRDNLHHNLA